jgi:hypothetical protein
MPAYPSFDENTLSAICDILADTSTGLTGSKGHAALMSQLRKSSRVVSQSFQRVTKINRWMRAEVWGILWGWLAETVLRAITFRVVTAAQ